MLAAWGLPPAPRGVPSSTRSRAAPTPVYPRSPGPVGRPASGHGSAPAAPFSYTDSSGWSTASPAAVALMGRGSCRVRGRLRDHHRVSRLCPLRCPRPCSVAGRACGGDAGRRTFTRSDRGGGPSGSPRVRVWGPPGSTPHWSVVGAAAGPCLVTPADSVRVGDASPDPLESWRVSPCSGHRQPGRGGRLLRGAEGRQAG